MSKLILKTIQIQKHNDATDSGTNEDNNMKKDKIKVYLYTRVSTTMQIDGYSLDAQKTKMKAFCDYIMSLYLSFPDLEEMRQMSLQHYK